ncbi:F-box/FBD/LRR-repeat protein family [Quillaja saponaria]|uniref:F-box/FBD/LRR-repeat protein family n=1 Tax=Quillaja saponaria TaxID=32244 RepID=A0AAD7KUJ9_QUISA|nr:F-box/FBD/LRR-repeat protein family [Quillaja saponaria]
MDGRLSTYNLKRQKLHDEENKNESADRIGNFPDEILQHILTLLPTRDAVRTSVLLKRWQYLWMSVTNIDISETDLPNMNEMRSLFLNFVERVLVLRESSDLRNFSLTCDVLTDVSQVSSWIYAAVRHHVRSMFLQLRFPALEKLSLDECGWWNVNAVNIAAPMLQTLTISEDAINHDNCRFFIVRKNLKYFYYVGQLKNDYYIYNSFSLAYAFIGLHGILNESGRLREVAYRADRLLRGLRYVKILLLTSYAFDVLKDVKELYASLPILYNLTCLKFGVGKAIDFGCGAVAKMLQNIPNLVSLIFTSGICLSTHHEEENWILNPVPSCFAAHLKSITINKFRGRKGELHVVKSLLENAGVLEKMVLLCHHNFSGGSAREMDVLRLLKMPPRASMCCSIIFPHFLR